MLKTRAQPQLTPAQLVVRHRQLAEQHLGQAAKAGRIEAETRHATMAGAHATLALVWQSAIDHGEFRAAAPTQSPPADASPHSLTWDERSALEDQGE